MQNTTHLALPAATAAPQSSVAPVSAPQAANQNLSEAAAHQQTATAAGQALQIGSYTVGDVPDLLLVGHPDIRY